MYAVCRYVFLVGMLMSQFTITGFDACAHMSEETKGADKSAPLAIVMAIGASAVAGFAYLMAIIFSIQVTTPSVTMTHVATIFNCGFDRQHVSRWNSADSCHNDERQLQQPKSFAA